MKLGTLHQILNPMTATWPKIEIFKIKDGGGRHLENHFCGHNSSTDCPISAKCMRKQNGMSTRAKWQNLLIFKIQDGGRPPFWKSLNRHLSQKSSDSDEIWYTTSDIEPDYSHVKIEIFKIQGNRFFAITHQPIVRFQRNFVWGSRTACPQGLNDKICKCLKSKMADGRHFENR